MKLNLKEISKPIIAPSLLAADRLNLVSESKKAEAFGAKFLHIDVMDGKFVPNVSFSLDEIKKITHEHSILNDVHLMIEGPYKYIKDYYQAGADLITFHYEACQSPEEIHETIELIHSFGIYAGLSIKPMTDVEKLLPFIDELDLILLMSVEPGKGGQKFIPESLTRLDEIANLLKDKKEKPLIEIDGGINYETGKKALEHGAEVLVAGSYLYGHNDMEERLQNLLCK